MQCYITKGIKFYDVWRWCFRKHFQNQWLSWPFYNRLQIPLEISRWNGLFKHVNNPINMRLPEAFLEPTAVANYDRVRNHINMGIELQYCFLWWKHFRRLQVLREMWIVQNMFGGIPIWVSNFKVLESDDFWRISRTTGCSIVGLRFPWGIINFALLPKVSSLKSPNWYGSKSNGQNRMDGLKISAGSEIGAFLLKSGHVSRWFWKCFRKPQLQKFCSLLN